jgi:hypothetical protein
LALTCTSTVGVGADTKRRAALLLGRSGAGPLQIH